MKLTLHARELTLRHPFTIARGTTTVRPTLIVELEQEGQRGYGEATTNEYYGVTIASMSAALESVRHCLDGRKLADPASLWDELAPLLASQPFAQCALDEAAHDLWGKLRGAPVWNLWGLPPTPRPVTSYTIGIDTVERMIAKLDEFPDWPIYKIKLGTPDDLAMVQALRRRSDALFRVDANCGWTVDGAIANSVRLAELNVEFIEQPLPAGDWSGMRRLMAESALPLIADESCQRPEDVSRCAGHFHGINIKLVKCGGLTPARRMIAAARELGLKVMVGCMTESTVGISAIAQLLPLLDYVDMDGPLLLAHDIATGVRIEQGEVHFADVPGTGARLLPAETR